MAELDSKPRANLRRQTDAGHREGEDRHRRTPTHTSVCIHTYYDTATIGPDCVYTCVYYVVHNAYISSARVVAVSGRIVVGVQVRCLMERDTVPV